MEKIAREMLAKDAELRKEFEERLKDETFAQKRGREIEIFLRALAVFRQTHRTLSGRQNSDETVNQGKRQNTKRKIEKA